MKVGGNEKLEIYDYPGEYAQRFDGIQPEGGDRAGDLQKIFQDNRRTTDIRIQEEAVPGLAIQGASNCRDFVSGYKFTLQNISTPTACMCLPPSNIQRGKRVNTAPMAPISPILIALPVYPWRCHFARNV